MNPPKPSEPIELDRLSEILFDNFYGHGLSKEIETATQALEALVNDECQRVKSEAYNKGFWLAVEMPESEYKKCKEIIATQNNIRELRATESPLKKEVKE